MRLLMIESQDGGIAVLYRILLKSILSKLNPILITGEFGFPYQNFIRYSRSLRIPFEEVGKLNVVSAVNMHHIKRIIDEISGKYLDSGAPCFFNFCRHYIDENVQKGTAEFLFYRDMGLIQTKIQEKHVPVCFYESGEIIPKSQHQKLRHALYINSDCCMEVQKRTVKVLKNTKIDKFQEELSNGSANPNIRNLFGRFIQRMECLQKNATPKRSGFL